jgi:hypothetical protein
MSSPAGPRPTEPDMWPEPYPWCLSCGFQHDHDEHCPECTGDHSGGFCMTPEAEAELARLTPAFLAHVEEQAEALVTEALAFLLPSFAVGRHTSELDMRADLGKGAC